MPVALGAEAIRALLVGKQAVQGEQVVAPDQQVFPTLLERDQRVKAAVENQIGRQKKFVEGILNLNRSPSESGPRE